MKNHYQTLGVEWNVGLERIKQAYQELKIQYQKQPKSDFTKERLNAIEEAYSILRNSIKREKYDVDYFMYFVKGEGNQPIESANLVTMVSGNRKGIIDLRTNKVEFEEETEEEKEELANPFKLVLPVLVVGISLGLVYLNFQNWQVQANKPEKTQVVQTQKKQNKVQTSQAPQKLVQAIIEQPKAEAIDKDEPLLAMHTPEHNEINDYILPKSNIIQPQKPIAEDKTIPESSKSTDSSISNNFTQIQEQPTETVKEEVPKILEASLMSMPVKKAPKKYKRPHSGFSPYKAYFGQYSSEKNAKNKLHITNEDRNDAVVCLVEKRTNQVVQHAYIRSTAKYTFDEIPNGDYYLKAYYGKKWSEDKAISRGLKGGFEQNEIYEIYDSQHEVFEMTQYTENFKVHYTQYQVQLGDKTDNYKSSKIRPTTFFKK